MDDDDYDGAAAEEEKTFVGEEMELLFFSHTVDGMEGGRDGERSQQK